MSAEKSRTRKRLHAEKARHWPIITIGLVATVALAVGLAVLFLKSGSGPSAAPISRVVTKDYHALALVPGNPNLVLFGHHEGILRSTDGGRTWAATPGLRNDAMNLAVDHQSPQTMYLAGHNVFMRSDDGGQTWKSVPNNLPGLDLHWFAMNPDNPADLYTNAVGFGWFTSSDGGETWSQWNIQVPVTGSVTALAILGGEPVNVLAGTEESLLLYSHDGGANWEEAGRGDSRPMAFALSPETRAIYLGTAKGVYRSADGGLSWTRLPLNTTVASLTAGESNPERVMVVNNKGEVFLSDDGGQTW